MLISSDVVLTFSSVMLHEFPSAPCLSGGKKKLLTARVSMLLKSRPSLTCFRDYFLRGRGKDLSAPLYAQYTTAFLHPQSLPHRKRAVSATKKGRKCTYKCNIEAHSHNHLLQGKSKKCYIFWLCVCSLNYPAHRSACALLYYHMWSLRRYNRYFSTLSHRTAWFW